MLEALHLLTGRPVYQTLCGFWLEIFGVAFGLGVVSGVVMAFEFGTNWSVLPIRLERSLVNASDETLHAE